MRAHGMTMNARVPLVHCLCAACAPLVACRFAMAFGGEQCNTRLVPTAAGGPTKGPLLRVLVEQAARMKVKAGRPLDPLDEMCVCVFMFITSLLA